MIFRESLLLKSRLIFIPFLIIASSFISLYTLFNCLFYQTELLKLDNMLVKFWLPAALPWGPILIWLRPRINLLRLERKNGKDWDGLYYFVAGAAIIVPTIILQHYLDEAYGKLTPLSTIEELDASDPVKFYTIKNFYVNKQQSGVKMSSQVSGKHNQNLDFTVFVSCPILPKSDAPPVTNRPSKIKGNPLYVVNGLIASVDIFKTILPQDIAKIDVLKGEAAVSLYGNAAKQGVVLITLKPRPSSGAAKELLRMNVCNSWLCISYDTTISNRLDPGEKQRLYSEFLSRSEQTFKKTDPSNFTYLRRIPEGSDKLNYKNAIAKSKYKTGVNPALFIPVYEPFEARGDNKLKWASGTFLVFSSLFYMMLLLAKLSIIKLGRLSNPKVQKLGAASIYKFIQEQAALYVTWTIVLLNAIVFFAMVFNGHGFLTFQVADLIEWGANYGPYVKQGQWWRLLSSVFLHGGIMHLLLNIYGLVLVGVFLEPMLGRLRFTLSYLLFGILSSLASFLWYKATLSVGASGAIFGLYGMFLTLLLTNLFPKDFRKALLLNTALYVGLNLIMGLAGGIDNAAHFGGLLSGVIIGFILYFDLKTKMLKTEALNILSTKN